MHKHGTKTTPVFLPADGEASWLLLPSLVSLLSGSTVQPENTYSCILKMTGQKAWQVRPEKDCESLLESNSPGILALSETNLDDSIASHKFLVGGYLHLMEQARAVIFI